MDDDRDTPGSSRRRYLKLAGTVAAGGLFAGCTGGADGANSPESSATETTNGSYSVSMAPVGEVSFDAVPETWVANNGSWADMGIALGQAVPKGVWLPSRFHTRYYDDIPGVDVDASDVRKLWGESGVGKEQFYELDADLHVMDPNFLTNRAKWDQSDVDEIADGVAPFFGNSIFSRSYGWHDSYEYYSLYEAFEKLSQVFRQGERFEAFSELHDEFQSSLSSVLPKESDRPAVAVTWAGGDQPETFYPYVVSEGTSFKHLRDLGVSDAFANSDVKDFHSSRGAIDYETLLEVDPEVLLVRGQEAKSAKQFRNTVLSFMRDHDVASELTAVQNGDVFRAGPLYQGPISNLVVTERTAQSLYGTDEKLFDRKRVGDIVAGEF